ncbi:MAG: hypothetical protein WBH81_10560, partial [Tepidanaerobacteraceae bacterium]
MFCGETIVPERLTGPQLSFNFTIRGGAVGMKKMIFEPTFKEKEDKSQKEKSIIAKTAASLIEDNDT